MKSILSPEFRYVPAAKTDIKKTFARIRKQQQANAQEVSAKVEPLRKSRTAA